MQLSDVQLFQSIYWELWAEAKCTREERQKRFFLASVALETKL